MYKYILHRFNYIYFHKLFNLSTTFGKLKLDNESIKFQIERGCGEGLKLSPLFFNIILGLAIEKLYQESETHLVNGVRVEKPILSRVITTAYADDICLIGRKRSQLMEALKLLIKYTEPFGLQINGSKSSFTC